MHETVPCPRWTPPRNYPASLQRRVLFGTRPREARRSKARLDSPISATPICHPRPPSSETRSRTHEIKSLPRTFGPVRSLVHHQQQGGRLPDGPAGPRPRLAAKRRAVTGPPGEHDAGRVGRGNWRLEGRRFGDPHRRSFDLKRADVRVQDGRRGSPFSLMWHLRRA